MTQPLWIGHLLSVTSLHRYFISFHLLAQLSQRSPLQRCHQLGPGRQMAGPIADSDSVRGVGEAEKVLF